MLQLGFFFLCRLLPSFRLRPWFFLLFRFFDSTWTLEFLFVGLRLELRTFGISFFFCRTSLRTLTWICFSSFRFFNSWTLEFLFVGCSVSSSYFFSSFCRFFVSNFDLDFSWISFL